MPFKNIEDKRAHERAYYAANKDRLLSNQKRYIEKNGRSKHNPKAAKKYINSHLEKYLLNGARKRAKENGLEFDLTESDISIPEFCPVLGIKLERTGNRSDSTPSLDRIDNTKGYIKGNIIVVSWRANRLKFDATLEELRCLYTFYRDLSIISI